MTRRRAASATVALAVLALPASAHVINDPRVVVLVPKPASFELRINELTQPGEESIALRRRFDVDRNGKLDDSESSDLASFLVTRATANLRVWQEGKALPLQEVTRSFKAGPSLGSSDSLSLDLILTTKPAADAGHVKVTVGDWRPDGHAVRVAILSQDGVTLTKTSLGSLESGGQVATGISLEQTSSEILEYDLPAKK